MREMLPTKNNILCIKREGKHFIDIYVDTDIQTYQLYIQQILYI